MKKVDKVVFKSFIGPFFLTLIVIVFILLTQHMLKYFDDLVGKDLGWDVLGQLLIYFAIFVTPFAFPLSVLLSSLMTFGNLGEHSELTALKSGGISLPRAMRSIFVFSILLSGVAFLSNNYLVPKAALEAYSLMWDIKRKKPALDLKEGEFYGGIPNYRIRVEKKFKDGETLKGVIIYDHSKGRGNNEVTIADSGKMSTIMGERYLKLELFDGHSFIEGSANRQNVSRKRQDLKESLSKVKFASSEMIFDLESFDLERTDKELFRRNRLMRNLSEMETDMDSIYIRSSSRLLDLYYKIPTFFDFQFKSKNIKLSNRLEKTRHYRDSLSKVKGDIPAEAGLESGIIASINNRVPKDEENNEAKAARDLKILSEEEKVKYLARLDKNLISESKMYNDALYKVRQAKNNIYHDANYIEGNRFETKVYLIQYHKIIANSIACIVMFLIGASLGSIIKKGGLGVPVLVSILFFIVYYVFIMTGEKWAKNDEVYPWVGIWSANFFLLPLGLFFLRQAGKDARLFDSDFYNVIIEKVKRRIGLKNKSGLNTHIENDPSP